MMGSVLFVFYNFSGLRMYKQLCWKENSSYAQHNFPLQVKRKLCRNNASGVYSGATQHIGRNIDILKFCVLFIYLFETDLTTLQVTATV